MDDTPHTTGHGNAPERTFLDRTLPPQTRTRHRLMLRRIAVLIVVIGLGLGINSWLRTQRAPSEGGSGDAAQSAREPIGAATIGTGDIRIIVNALGTVTPLATVTVQTQISGRIMEVGFTEGQLVTKGDFLAQIDARPFELLKAQYEGQLAHDQGLLAQAESNLSRYQRLAEQNSIARQQYEDQIYLVQQDQGTVKLDQAQVDQQTLNITYCRILSPINGYIGLRLVDPGNYVQTTNSTGIAVVTQLQPITVVFPIPEDNLQQIRERMRAGKTLEVTAYDRANVTKLATGKVTALDSQIDTATGTVKLRAEFDNANDELFPNQFVNARLLVLTLHDVVTVPIAAVQSVGPSIYVYLINPDDTVSIRPIKLGPTDGELTQVESGLAAGDRVVVDGADRLRDGARVTIPADGSQHH
jgi:membrane fusion protein, multidrug efflux system